jgi:hypothetical protein
MVALNVETVGDLLKFQKRPQLIRMDLVKAIERLIRNLNGPNDDVAAAVLLDILSVNGTMTNANFRTELFVATRSTLAVFRNFRMGTCAYTCAVIVFVRGGASVDTMSAVNEIPVGAGQPIADCLVVT